MSKPSRGQKNASVDIPVSSINLTLADAKNVIVASLG